MIAAAADGDERAMERLLVFYDAYISKASLRPLYDEYGNVYIAVDMELKGRIREAMIRKMQRFEMKIK
nr:helix-turn-helix domain-containing protein [Lacrimispora amygdalina]